MNRAIILSTLSLVSITASAGAATVVRSGTGANAGELGAGGSALTNFQTDVSAGGGVNAPGAGPFATGRREINWDAPALDGFASPNLMPNNFFNNNSKRGATFLTPGDGFLVSQRGAQAGFTNSRFGEIDPSYSNQFITFSAERLFAARGSTVTDVFFFVPSSPGIAATVNGFGAVFADVDSDASTYMEFFDLGGTLLDTVFASPRNGGLTFLGASFNAGERVARVRIHSGNLALGAGHVDGDGDDVVVMDDFIYSEPQEAPAPGAAALVGVAGLASLRRRR